MIMGKYISKEPALPEFQVVYSSSGLPNDCLDTITTPLLMPDTVVPLLDQLTLPSRDYRNIRHVLEKVAASPSYYGLHQMNSVCVPSKRRVPLLEIVQTDVISRGRYYTMIIHLNM